MSPEEDVRITRLKKELDLPTKKAVILEGIQTLEKMRRERERKRRLQAASRFVAADSLQVNREWAPQSAARRASR